MKKIERLDYRYIQTREEVAEVHHHLSRSKVMFTSLDTEYVPGQDFRDKKNTENIKKRVPLLLSLSVVTRGRGAIRDGYFSGGYVFDLRRPEVREGLAFFRRATFKVVGHFLETDLITLAGMGIEMMPQVTYFDTFLAEKYREMGSGHAELDRTLSRIEAESDNAEQAEIQCAEAESDYYSRRYSLENVAERYGVAHRYLIEKKQLQESFANHPVHQPFETRQLDYAYEDAYVTSEIYLAQAEHLIGDGIQTYLEQTVLPLIPHLTKSQWLGALVDVEKLSGVHKRVMSKVEEKTEFMARAYGLKNFRSHTQRKTVLARLGIINRVTDRDGKVSLSKDKVKELKNEHAYFKDHAEMSHFLSTQSSIEKILDLADDENHLHSRFVQLQAKTGRITTTRPAPFDKNLRPIIIPSKPGYGIFELDIGQAEVWLVACMSGDLGLQEACESYDVYLRLGIEIVRGRFDEEDVALILQGPKEKNDLDRLGYLKKVKYGELRSKLLKPLVLAILYGQTESTVAKKTKQAETFIREIFSRLRKTYPNLFQYIDQNIKYGSKRGYLELPGGFRIHVSGSENVINRLKNNPVQGMCAVLFNRALLQCYESAPRFGARILFPLYDAIVVEAPVNRLAPCSEAMAAIFTNVLQSAFPDAVASVKMDTNDEDTSCWNDDGKTDSLEDIPVRRKP